MTYRPIQPAEPYDHFGSLIAAAPTLQRVYPSGVPTGDYYALLVVLHEDMSERGLAAVVAEPIEDEDVVVANDAAAAPTRRKPSDADVRRVRSLLLDAGWEPEEI